MSGTWRCLAVLCGVAAVVNSVHLPPLYPEDSSSKILDGATYDFIVVGAGAAGCAVAGRLSEWGAEVLLLEAGPDPDIRSRVPSLSVSLMASDVDWHYETLPNGKSCLASQGEQCSFSRGKVLGGSTSINYMMYTRGNRRDLDNWNITGWTWNDLEPYYLKFENLKALNKLPASSAKYHNNSGPVKLEFFTNSQNHWHQHIIDGFLNLNFPYNYDVNAESQIGVSQIIGYVNDGERETTARAYLSPAVTRPNLHVAKNAHVTRVILDDATNVALGVSVQLKTLLQMTREVKLYARKEVILSAGAVGTPQILMLSGIGPSKHLQNFGIRVRVNLSAVGDGLADHVLPLIILKVDRGFGIDFPNIIPFLDDGANIARWIATQDGPYASNGLTDATAFVNTNCYDFDNHKMSDCKSEECQIPNLQFIHAYVDRDIIPTVERIFAKSIGLNPSTVKQLKDANVNHAFIVMSPVLLYPESRGWIKLNSSDPLDPPCIHANYLDSKKDVDQLILAMRIVEDLVNTEPFRAHNASILKLNFKACAVLRDDSDEYRECYIRQMTHSVYHGMCTTALGRVVDEELRVKGVSRLRVADGGVMAALVRGNTAATCIAIGEKAADLIAKTHNLNGKLPKRLTNIETAVRSLAHNLLP